MREYVLRGWAMLFAALLLGCVGSMQPSAAEAPGSATALSAALNADKPFVLVVSPAQPDQALLESEAYADWASALAEFQARASLPVVTASSEDYRRAIADPALKDGFATLFVKGGGRALLHQGRLLDPFLYDCGSNYLRSLPTCSEVPAYGMPEVRVKRR